MKTQKIKEEKIKYQELLKIIQKAEKEALKFVRQNKQLDPELQVKYS